MEDKASGHTPMEMNDGDILYFCHIPKTAGTSLIDFIDSHFHYESILQPKAWLELLPNMPQSFSKIRFVRGHFGFWVYRILPKTPIYITMLRDPKDVIVSAYKMIQRQPKEAERYSIPQDKPLSDLITDSAAAGMRNMICHWLAADLDIMSLTKDMEFETLKHYYPESEEEFRRPDLQDHQLFDLAKSHLSKFAFVGLAEKYEESLLLMCYIFGWKPVRRTVKMNVAPSDTEHKDLTDEAKLILADWTRADERLYAYGRDLFDINYSRMCRELRDKYYDPGLSHLSSFDLTFKLLSRHYEHIYAATRYSTDSIEFRSSQAIDGSGWYAPIISKHGVVYRWTGPERSATLDLPLKAETDMTFQINIINAMSSNLIKTLKVNINGRELVTRTLGKMFRRNAGLIKGTIPREFLESDKPFTQLEISLSDTFSPSSVNPASKDKRKLGVAIDWIKIFPAIT